MVGARPLRGVARRCGVEQAVIAVLESAKRAAGPALWLLIAAVVCVLAVTPSSIPPERALPTGCDEFGYLNMARAIGEGRLLSDHAARPFHEALLADLQSTGRPWKDYAWMVAPHAYHVDDRTFQVINQYPPGTPLLLMLAPIELRSLAFPGLCVLLWILPLFAALRWGLWLSVARASSLTALLVLGLISVWPFTTELPHVNSVAPTYGLLLAAGLLLRTRLRWAAALVGAASLFRVANVLAFLPVALAVAWPSGQGWKSWLGERPRRLLAAGAALLVGGFGVYLLYAWARLGNPFASTYSPIDRAFNDWAGLGEHARFYFAPERGWALVHLVGLAACLAVTWLIEHRWRWLVLALVATLANYAFYITHQVKIFYYPFATAVLVLGIALQPLVSWAQRQAQWALALVHGAAAAGLLLLAYRVQLPDVATVTNQFREQVAWYREAFARHDVIWAEDRSGTVEYATGRAAFRFPWGPDDLRLRALQWLYAHGYSQAIWISDLPDLRHRERAALDVGDLPTQWHSHAQLGTYAVIPPAR